MAGRWVALLLWLGVISAPRLAAQCPDGSPPPCRSVRVAVTAPAPNSVAVLYFDNFSTDTADAYLADGLTEALTERLGRIERLAIKSRIAVHRFRGRRLDEPVALGRSLQVMYLVSGSVRRVGNRIRVTAELTRAATGLRVWGESFARPVGDLMTVEAELAENITLAVSGRLAASERRSLASTGTNDRRAYDHYLRGLTNLHRRFDNERAVVHALQEFKEAVDFDPGFSHAQARLGFAYALLLGPRYAGSLPIPDDSLLGRGLAAAHRALALDSTIADAWVALGILLNRRDSTSRIDQFERAIAIDAQNTDALNAYGVILLNDRADVERSRAVFERAVVIDPYQPVYLFWLGLVHFAARRFTDALVSWDSAVAIAPQSTPPLANRAMGRLAVGDTAGALRDANTVLQLVSRPSNAPLAQAIVGLLNLHRGDTAGATRVANEIVDDPRVPDSRRGLAGAAILVALGEHERAINYLERVRPQRGAGLPLYLSFVHFDPIRSHPRFQRLVDESRPQ